MDTAPASTPPTAGPAPPPSAVLTAWPRSAQLTTAFLLGVVLTLLIVQATGLLRWGSRPSELEAAPPIAYRIDLNRATRAELLQMPGVGPALADRIVAYRQESGGFRSVEDLTKVPGIGPATLARLRSWVSVTVEEGEPARSVAAAPAAPVKKTKTPPTTTEPSEGHKTASKKEGSLDAPLDINQATQQELQRLPGIGPALSQRIIDARNRTPFKTVDDLRRVSGIGAKTLEKLRPYVTVSETPRVVAAE